VAQARGVYAEQELAGCGPGDGDLADLRLALPRGQLDGSHRGRDGHRGSPNWSTSIPNVLDIDQKLN
jgi:hypothetical protein